MACDSSHCYSPVYTLKKEICKGAESVVFAAEIFGLKAVAKQRRKKRFVNEKLWESLSAQRARKEVRALAELGKQGILVPKVFYCDSGTSTIVIEKINGKTLDKSVGPAQYKKAARLLARLHLLGFWHGDYNPKNLILQNRTGNLFLIDLGLSKSNARNEEMAYDVLTMMKSVIGKKQAMAFLEEYRKLVPEVFSAYSKIAALGRYK